MAHFGEFATLRERLLKRGKLDKAEKVGRALGLIDSVAVTQDEPVSYTHLTLPTNREV